MESTLEVFRQEDTGGIGKMPAEVLRDVLGRIGMSTEVVDELIRAADVGADGLLDYGKLLAYCFEAEDLSVQEDVHQLARQLAEPAPGSLDAVRAAYAVSAQGGAGALPLNVGDPSKRNKLLGYEGAPVNDSADLGLGCGNPLITANLRPGEIVVDLGSGAGMDCFIAAKAVGSVGHVIGVDMTAEMLTRARRNAEREGITNVSFRMGEIEHLPVGDGVIDCLISNCVINLSLDKPQVYREMNRVLKPGGRVSISDVLKQAELPSELKTSQAYVCWVSGASAEDDMREMLQSAGFKDISIQIKEGAADVIKDWMPGSGAEKYITSAYITATKPTHLWGFRDDPKQGIAFVGGAAEIVPAASAPAAQTAAGCWG